MKPTVVLSVAAPASAAVSDKPAPRIEPTIKESLAIGQLVEQYFSVTAGAYEAGWSDEAISKKLNLPRAMVVKVREEAYGPLKVPPELASLKSEIDTVAVMIRDLSRRVADEIAKYGSRV